MVSVEQAEKTCGCGLKFYFNISGGVDSAARYGVLKEMATQAGDANWECAALDPTKQ
jgi:hypothetical protein